MRTPSISRILVAAFAAVTVVLPATASACSVCMGDPASKTAGAMNAALFLLLGFVGFMLCSVAAFAYYLKSHATSSVPPQTEIASMISHPEDSK